MNVISRNKTITPIFLIKCTFSFATGIMFRICILLKYKNVVHGIKSSELYSVFKKLRPLVAEIARGPVLAA